LSIGGKHTNQMKRRLTYVFAAGILATGLAFTQTQTAPQAGEGRQGAKAGRQGKVDGQQRKAKRFERMANHLNLTPEQRVQARNLAQQARNEAQPLMEQLRTNRQQLSEAVKSGNQAEIQRLSSASGVLKGQLTAIFARHMQEGYAMLTPEQRQKADELRAKMGPRFGRHLGPRG
jgi:Spy/CpxP family protein refolding chaperone